MTDLPAPANLNAWWCRELIATLSRCGVREAVTCPGNRNVPLLFALAEHPDITCHPQVDERSAGFRALGLAIASGRPVVICTTSGSAVANLHPAMVEARHAGVPLVALTADRPEALQDCEAPQTTTQVGIFGPSCPDCLELEAPVADGGAIRRTRHAVARILHRSAGASPGPVHLNQPLDDPLPPVPDPGFMPPPLPADEPAEPSPERPTVEVRTADNPLQRLELRPGLRGLIVSGVRNPLTVEDTAALARATGFPVLADVCGHGRDERIPHLITTGDALCSGPLVADRAELVIRLGPAPLARPVFEWLQQQACPILRIERHPVAADFCHRSFVTLVRPSRHELERLAGALATGDGGWRERWLAAEARIAGVRAATLAGETLHEPSAVAAALARDDYRLVVAASSLSVRHCNLVAGPQQAVRLVHSNRGLNGIDGTIGTFLGLLAHREPGIAILGDLAFLHDLPALAAADGRQRGTLLVLDNGGGAIFDLLPVSEVAGYRELIRTPQRLDPVTAASAFGLAGKRCDDLASLREALDWSLAEPGVQIIHAVLGEDGAGDYRGLLREMAALDGGA